MATPQVIGRHAHPKARPEQPAPPPAPPTGIDYLRLVEADHRAADARRINFDALTSQATDQPGDATPPRGEEQSGPDERETS
jgi:putative transposase